jgi:hypothetical protein
VAAYRPGHCDGTLANDIFGPYDALQAPDGVLSVALTFQGLIINMYPATPENLQCELRLSVSVLVSMLNMTNAVAALAVCELNSSHVLNLYQIITHGMFMYTILAVLYYDFMTEYVNESQLVIASHNVTLTGPWFLPTPLGDVTLTLTRLPIFIDNATDDETFGAEQVLPSVLKPARCTQPSLCYNATSRSKCESEMVSECCSA